ncbi:MAG TPA: alpha/beta hydrolase-fold protein, partial [Longimicrobium sp.]
MRSILVSAAILAAAFSVFAVTPADAQVTMRVRMPAVMPADSPVYVAGSFNGWNPGDPGSRLAEGANGEYTITLPETVRGPIEFKFTLGVWERVEVDSAGASIPNRRFVVPATGAATWRGTVAGWQDPGKIPARKSTRRPTVTVLDTAFPIPQLHRTRRVWVYLPPDYASSSKRYPVLYMHDGQNVFDDSTSGFGEWGVDETLDSLFATGDPGVIVVAVDHGGAKRLDEYSPFINPRHGGGEGDAYVDFLAQTLKPLIDRRYRTRPDRLNTGVAGSSMGGLISLYAALKYPDVFGRAGIFSPSLWFSDRTYAY